MHLLLTGFIVRNVLVPSVLLISLSSCSSSNLIILQIFDTEFLRYLMILRLRLHLGLSASKYHWTTVSSVRFAPKQHWPVVSYWASSVSWMFYLWAQYAWPRSVRCSVLSWTENMSSSLVEGLLGTTQSEPGASWVPKTISPYHTFKTHNSSQRLRLVFCE
jgi:hypothetical protein